MLVAAARRHAIRCSEVTLGCGNRRFRGGSTGDFGRAACGAGGGGGLTLYAGRADACTAAVVGGGGRLRYMMRPMQALCMACVVFLVRRDDTRFCFPPRPKLVQILPRSIKLRVNGGAIGRGRGGSPAGARGARLGCNGCNGRVVAAGGGGAGGGGGGLCAGGGGGGGGGGLCAGGGAGGGG